MSSKRDSKRIKQKQQQNYLSPVRKRNINQFDLNPLNLRDLSPFRPIYGSHQTPTHVHLSNTQLTIIETPANTVPKGLYLEQIEEGVHSISAVINWEQEMDDDSGSQDEDSQILQLSQDQSSSKSERKVTQPPIEKSVEKEVIHNLRTAEPKQKKDSHKKMTQSQSTASASSSKKVFCNCKKTKCLKLYCDCFRINQTCDGCNCVGCHNLPVYEEQRNNSMLTLMDRNPEAFKPKIDEEQHAKGCHCRKSNCLKKYCQCYQAGLKCGSNCKCEECKNGNCGEEFERRDQNLSSHGFQSLIVNLQNLMEQNNDPSDQIISSSSIKTESVKKNMKQQKHGQIIKT